MRLTLGLNRFHVGPFMPATGALLLGSAKLKFPLTDDLVT